MSLEPTDDWRAIGGRETSPSSLEKAARSADLGMARRMNRAVTLQNKYSTDFDFGQDVRRRPVGRNGRGADEAPPWRRPNGNLG
jgi:hypothetical protein